MLTNIVQGIINALVFLLNFIVSVLPRSPFSSHWGSLILENNLLQALGWIIPFKSILALSGAWLGAVSLFYLYSIGLRWIKAID